MSQPPVRSGVTGAITSLLGRRKREAEAAEARVAALRSDRFRLEREGDWLRLEHIVGRLEAGRTRGLSDQDLLDLPVLYRSAVSSLSIARETTLDAQTLAYLEALVRRAWFQVYGPRTGFAGWARGFFGGGWSRAVRALATDIWIALALMVAGTVIGWLLVAADPDWFGALMPSAPGDVRVPGASRKALYDVIFDHSHAQPLSTFAAALFGHNAQIAILCFAVGFAFGIPTILLLLQNSGMLGAILWLYHGQGLTFELVGWLSIHGTTELFALLLGSAAGLHVGRAMVFPGALGVLEATAAAGRRAALVMVGVVLMLLVAGVLEGVMRQVIEDTVGRLSIGLAMLAFWLWYFAWFGRRRA
jgi:uncharacterized membrane protein SpoIIM required for sporulation